MRTSPRQWHRRVGGRAQRCPRVWSPSANMKLLRDSILSWADKFIKEVGHDVTRLVVGKKEIHITPGTRPRRAEELEELGRECQEAAVREWIREKITK